MHKNLKYNLMLTIMPVQQFYTRLPCWVRSRWSGFSDVSTVASYIGAYISLSSWEPPQRQSLWRCHIHPHPSPELFSVHARATQLVWQLQWSRSGVPKQERHYLADIRLLRDKQDLFLLCTFVYEGQFTHTGAHPSRGNGWHNTRLGTLDHIHKGRRE